MSSPFSYPGPVTDLDALATNRLIPEDDARTFGVSHNPLGDEVPSRAEWKSTVQVNDVTFGPPKNPLKAQKPGDEVAVLSVRCSIDPMGGPSKNLGRRVSANMYFNMTALDREGDGHATMTRNSFGSLYALVKALGLPGDVARDPSTLVEEYRPQILGRRLLAVIEQTYNEEKDRYYDNIRSFASTGE